MSDRANMIRDKTILRNFELNRIAFVMVKFCKKVFDKELDFYH